MARCHSRKTFSMHRSSLKTGTTTSSFVGTSCCYAREPSRTNRNQSTTIFTSTPPRTHTAPLSLPTHLTPHAWRYDDILKNVIMCDTRVSARKNDPFGGEIARNLCPRVGTTNTCSAAETVFSPASRGLEPFRQCRGRCAARGLVP